MPNVQFFGLSADKNLYAALEGLVISFYAQTLTQHFPRRLQYFLILIWTTITPQFKKTIDNQCQCRITLRACV